MADGQIDTQAELMALNAEVAGCPLCDLQHSRVKAVPGDGPIDAEIMFIGEAPGYHENMQGRPFVGPSGQFLDELLAYPKQVHDAEGLTALAFDLAHEVGNPKLAVYDFIDLALAIGLNCRLVTADPLFRDALQATPLAHRLLWVTDPL